MRLTKHDVVFDLETCPREPSQKELEKRKAAIDKEIENWSAPKTMKKQETIDKAHAAFVTEQYSRDIVEEYYNEKCFTPAYLEIVAATFVFIERGSNEIQDVKTIAGWDCIQQLPSLFSSHLETTPRMIGFNSDGFDKPVLLSCLAKHNVILSPKLGTSYDSWLDLRKLLTGFGGRGTLKEYTNLFGIDEYEDGEDGSRVKDWALAGNWEDLALYAEKDTVATAELFLRLSGVLNL